MRPSQKKKMQNYVFRAPIVRRMPDPVFTGCQRHVLMGRVVDVPSGLPKDPNPRAQNTDRLIWKEIRRHLMNEEGTDNSFHLKNKGITMLANQVSKVDGSDDQLEVLFEPDIHGIVDGGHTYDLITSAADDIRELQDGGSSLDPFVKFEILTGYQPDIHAEVAGGLNTAIQVQETSLANLAGKFDWIKEVLEIQPYGEQVAYRENEAERAIDVRDVVSVLYMFNIKAFPNGTDADHPVSAYTSKARVLDHYLRHVEQYRALGGILHQILQLHDIIAREARDLHNKGGGRGGKLVFVEQRKRGEFDFPFTGKTAKWRLARAALYPMLAAFRWMVTLDDESGVIGWRHGFERTIELWRSEGAKLMRETQATSDNNGRKIHAIGRSSSHWETLYKNVAVADLMRSTGT